MQSSNHQAIKQSSCLDYIFDSWSKSIDTSRTKEPQQIKLKSPNRRQNHFQYKSTLDQNYEYDHDQISTTKSQLHQKNYNVPLNSYINNLDGRKDERKDVQFLSIKRIIKNQVRAQTINLQIKVELRSECIANYSTIFSQPIKNSQPNSLSYSLNCKLILPKIKQIKTQKVVGIRKFQVICKVIGKFILLFYHILPSTSPKRILINSKVKLALNLRKTFKFDRNIKQSLSKSFKQWIEPSLQKIFYYLQNSFPKIFQENIFDQREVQDSESIWTLNFAKFLFQNLELITRKGNIPKEIINAMSQSIYKENNQFVQLFVAQRTHFNKKPFSIMELQLLSSEYILFNGIVIQLFELANNLKYQSFNHNVNCKIQVLKLVSILNLYYIRAFQDMPLINQNIQEDQLYTRMIHITPDEDQLLQLLDTKEKSKQESMILGLKHEQQIQLVLQQREKQNQKLELLFKKFIHNLGSQVVIF
ncbi:unnamed protein product (macronuclear) [Paramecium tetraurelia]|uniref:Uncharacterized protein n=1 Tax=Paramecium tetraurelia TaxID=5888 RepID=A0CL92_PARTE|nr:uncharacterized protein GSPATT00008106001 [Paramecium tetraurelia]CAK71559.1 unnamed protein product [Paramecium tetraurelia]|eukprot:XP_001438956.1 hypothetical protein (macronuclear) [Paramecium tetraurelia strain d4-2]